MIEKHISDGHNLDNQNITITSRRIIHDYKISQLRKEVGRLGGNPGLKKIRENRENLVNQTPNQKDQSSSSSSSSKQKKIYKRKVLSDEEFLASLKEKFTWRDVDRELIKMDAWLLANPERQKTRKFIVKWLSKDKPLQIKKETIKPQQTDQTPTWIKEAVKDGWKG